MFRIPKFLSPDTFIAALRGHERIAGLVIEETRVRAAELTPPSGKRTTPAVFSEGAVKLPEGTIVEGKVADAKKLLTALKQLLRTATPRSLSAHSVVLSVPALPLFTKTITLPPSVRDKEIAETLRLEAESILPIPMGETYLDWQRVAHDNSATEGEEYVVIAARREDLDPYIQAVRAAGLDPVAVEPFTLSIARGLRPDPTRPAFIAYLFTDAVLAAGLEADAVRFPHHVVVPSSPMDLRAQSIATELANFTRFLKSEEHQVHLAKTSGGLRLLVDGMVDDQTLLKLRAMSQELSIPVDFSTIEHELSKAAVRGAALRGIVPRKDDQMASLMSQGTEEAYARSRAAFFLSAVANVLSFGALAIVVISAIALGAVVLQEQAAQQSLRTQGSIPSETQELIDTVNRFNLAVGRASSVIDSQKDLFEPFNKALLVKAKILALKPQELEIRSVEVAKGGSMQVGVFAITRDALLQFTDALNASGLSLEKQVLPFDVQQKESNISYLFNFSVFLNPLTNKK